MINSPVQIPILRHLPWRAVLLVLCTSLSIGGFASDVLETELNVTDDRFYRLVAADSQVEILATELGWAEGPVWVASQQALLFSDVAANRVYRWSETGGLEIYLHPSGHEPDGNDRPWRGSNGLALDPSERLILAQQGSRRVARMDATLTEPRPVFTVLAQDFEGRSLNSPNDLVVRESGDLYFTDPPYGLDGFEDSPSIELGFFGVFRLDAYGSLTSLLTSLPKPNGIALSPDQSTLYVSNSEPGQEHIVAIELDKKGNSRASRVFFDARSPGSAGSGSTDGMTVHPSGTVFASVPNGIGVITSDGGLLGSIVLGQVTNLTFDDDAQYLYITTPTSLLRLRMVPKARRPD